MRTIRCPACGKGRAPIPKQTVFAFYEEDIWYFIHMGKNRSVAQIPAAFGLAKALFGEMPEEAAREFIWEPRCGSCADRNAAIHESRMEEALEAVQKEFAKRQSVRLSMQEE